MVATPTQTPDDPGLLPYGRLVDMFREAQDLSDTDRANQQRDAGYYYAHQYTAAELEVLRARKQPAIVVNLIRPAINNVVGFEIRQRQDPKALPRNPTEEDETKAELCTEALRYIDDRTRFKMHASYVSLQIFMRGVAAVEICVDPDDPQEIMVKRIMSTDFFYDPRSRMADFLDARYIGYAVWMDENEIVAEYPDKRDQILASYEQSSGSMTQDFEDRPLATSSWADTVRKRVLVVTICYQVGKTWYWARYVSGGILDQMVSPYLCDGKPACNILGVSGYVDEDGNRQGLVRDMVGPQDETNHRRSKLLHMMNTRQVVTEKGAVENVYHTQSQLVRPDGYVEVQPGMIDKFRIERNQDQVQGQAELLQDSKGDIMRVSPHSSMSEVNSPNASGRALMARQQTASMELAGFFDNLRDWRHRCYKLMWAMAQQFWTAPKFIRVTDDADDIRWLGLNQPVMQEPAMPGMEPQPAMQFVPDPEMGMRAEPMVENAVKEMDVDIVISEGADYAVIAQEQFDGMIGLAQAGVTFPPEFYVRASSLPNKKELLDAIKQPEPTPQQMQQEQLELAAQQADLEKKQSEAIKNLEQAEKYDAETTQIEQETGQGARLPTMPTQADLMRAQPNPGTGGGAATPNPLQPALPGTPMPGV